MSSGSIAGQAIRQVDRASNATLARRRDRRIMASAGAGVFQRVAQVVSTLIVMPLLIRVLGPTQFGIWGAAVSLAWLASLLDVGTGAALVTLVARSIALQDANDARRHIAGALSIGAAVALMMLMSALLASILGEPHGRVTPYLIAVIGLALNVPLNAGNNVWMALQKGYVSGFWELVHTLLTIAGLVGAALFTTDVRAYVAVVYGGLLLSNLGSLVHLWVRHPELRPRKLLVPLGAIREVAGSGILYFLLTVAGGLTYMLDNVLALELLGPAASASMTIALRLGVAAGGFIIVTTQPIWPAFTEAAEKADWRWVRRTLLRGSAVLVGCSAVGSALLLVYGERLLSWWLHTDLGIDRGLLWAVAVGILVHALIRIPNMLLNGLAIIRYQIVVYCTSTLLGFALKFVLARYLGVAGILWATNVTVLLLALPATIWRTSRWATQCGRGPTLSEWAGDRIAH